MSTSMIWIRALDLQRKSEDKTHTSKQPGVKFMSRLIAFLNPKNKKEVLKNPAEETEALKEMGVLK